MMSETELTVGKSIEVTIERLAYGGESIARHQGLAIFVQGAAPGDFLRVRIIERKKSFARAVIEEILTPSTARRVPPCKYFGQCGGCQLQHINYETQLEEKVGFIRDALKRTGHIDWTDEIKIYSADEFNYRLRARLQIAGAESSPRSDEPGQKPRKVKIGFHQAHSHTVCDIEHCEILLPELNLALQSIRHTLGRENIAPYRQLKGIEIAVSQSELSPTGTSDSQNSVSTAPQISGFSGNDILREVAGVKYRFAPSSFFQVNAPLIDEFARRAIGEASGQLAIELYAGVGLFTLQLARKFQRVVGVESNDHSVNYARRNISDNGLKNAEVVCQRAEDWLKNYLRESREPKPDLLLLDPPRSGAAEAIDLITRLGPKRIHYVSCDPATLARDLQKLVTGGYKIEQIMAFDMFPQTFHVETIVYLVKDC
jgi:23S rRNA (uracil1939-C5)-methyltransferase